MRRIDPRSRSYLINYRDLSVRYDLNSVRRFRLSADESRLVVTRQRARNANLSEGFPPSVRNTLRRCTDHLPCLRLRNLEKLAGFQGKIDRPIMCPSFKDRRLEMRIAIRCWVHVEHRRQAPLTRPHIEEAVVLQVIVFVGHEDREDQTPLEFAKVGHGVG